MTVVFIAVPLLVLLIAVVIAELRAPDPWIDEQDKNLSLRKPSGANRE